MATLPTLTLCDGLVDTLRTAWAPAAPDEVRRHYFVRTASADDEQSELTEGRRVTIAPATDVGAYSYEGHTRGKDLYTHRVSVLTEERYPESLSGDPTRDWLDERVNWVYTNVVQLFDFDKRDGNGPSFNRLLATLTIDVQVFDMEDLLSRGKLFSSQVDFVFQELVSV